MSLLKIIATSTVSAYDSILAEWDDIALTSPTTSGTNADIELVFDLGGSTRNLLVTYNGVGSLFYRIESGSYVLCNTGPAGTTFSITTGETLGFKYDNTVNINETRFVTVNDIISGFEIDRFDVSYSGGGDGGIGGGGGTGGGGGGSGEDPD